MAGQDLTLMSALTKKMDWQETRQKYLSENISNADTPNFKPLDLKPLDFKDLLKDSTSRLSLTAAGKTSGLVTTNPMHIGSGGTSGSSTKAKAKEEKNPYEVSPAGNAVDLEEQLLKMNENMTDHEFVADLYQKNITLLKDSTK